MKLEEQLKHRSYKRWVKGCLGFKYLGERLVETVNTIVKDQHENYMKNLSTSDCEKCSTKTLLPNHPKVNNKCSKGRKKCFCLMHTKSRTFCPNFFCSDVYDRIVDDHRYMDPTWSNTDITKWGPSYVEVAKCFISSAGYKDKLAITDIDCSGLLSIIINNKEFENTLTKQTATLNPLLIFTKARDDRNTVFHSNIMEITDDQLKDIINNMIVLLHLRGILDSKGETASSIEKLKQLRDVDIFISIRDEMDIQKETLQALEIKRQETVEEIEQSKQELLEKMESLNQHCEMKVMEINAKAERTDTDTAQLQTSIAELKKIYVELNQRQTESDLSLSQLQAVVKTLEEQHHEQDIKLKSIQKQISDVCMEIPEIIENHLRSKLKDMSAVSAIVDDHTKKLEYLQRKNVLQNKLSGYYKKCQSTIPVSPVLKTISGTVDEVFVELSIHENMDDMQNAEEMEQVLCYKSIFSKNDKLCENVYLLGDAGMGKTTWCKKVLNTWVKACCSGSSSRTVTGESEEDITLVDEANNTTQDIEDIKFLQKFDLLFYVALRQESEHVKVTDMIKRNPIVKEYSLQSAVDEVLNYESQTCLVLLDGLDEWSPVSADETPSREGLCGCLVLTTSRPYRLVGIRNVSDTFHADRIIEMTGVRNKELLVKKVIKQLNNAMKKQPTAKELPDTSDKDYINFTNCVKEMKDIAKDEDKALPNYMDIPLMLIITVCLWFYKGSVENTLARNIGGMIEFIISYAEGFESSVFWKKTVATEKLEGVENLKELKEEWSKSADNLPDPLRKRAKLKGYSGLIIKLSRFAFRSLFNAEHRIQLTFSQEDLLQYFNRDELRVLVKIGILSQSEVTEPSLFPMTQLSFIHKVFHEYLAGVYITMQLNLDKIKNVKILNKSFQNVVALNLCDNDNVLLHVGGLDPKAAAKMSEFLFKNLTFDIYMKNAVYLNSLYLRQVQVVCENYEHFPTEDYPIYTEYIDVPDDLLEENMKYLYLLLTTNLKHLKRIELPSNTMLAVLEKFKDVRLWKHLLISIYGINPWLDSAILTEALCFVPDLKRLKLRGLRHAFSNTRETVCLDLSPCSYLSELSLKNLRNITIKSKLPIQTVVQYFTSEIQLISSDSIE